MPAVRPVSHPFHLFSFHEIIIKSRIHIKDFIRKNIILFAAVTAAAVTSFAVPPDKKYINYFDVKTLSCLFCVLAMVCALRNIDFFTVIAKRVVIRFKTTRSCFLALCYITFIGSMFIANDMALLTFSRWVRLF
jgi:Na+/H+ antiporter NhaD/arsenite permease-like protein